MKIFAFALILGLVMVSCNKAEETAAGHDKEHHHVTETPDHAHADEHHTEHDHKAHHPNHDEEVKSDPHQ